MKSRPTLYEPLDPRGRTHRIFSVGSRTRNSSPLPLPLLRSVPPVPKSGPVTSGGGRRQAVTTRRPTDEGPGGSGSQRRCRPWRAWTSAGVTRSGSGNGWRCDESILLRPSCRYGGPGTCTCVRVRVRACPCPVLRPTRLRLFPVRPTRLSLLTEDTEDNLVGT